MLVLALGCSKRQPEPERASRWLDALQAVPSWGGFHVVNEGMILGAPRDADAALRAMLVAFRDPACKMGLGIGDGEALHHFGDADAVHLPRGRAVDAAVEALARALAPSARAFVSVSVPARVPVASGASFASRAATSRADEIEALLGVLALLVSQRTSAQWKVIDVVESLPHGTQQQWAGALGISHQAVSMAMTRSHYLEVARVLPLLSRLLQEADDMAASGW
ncbi:hypothetical protein JT358_04340 [Micrococcales bacterium 31B]|nr:hypothetical protein [Micrococcales bacterium 31B]